MGHLDRGTTGRLSVGDDASEVSVYVMNGEVVAARSALDDRQLIRRLWTGQVMDIARVASLEATAELGESVFGVLLEEVEPDLMENVLFERFRDNLATYLGHPDEPHFTEMSAVFVDNIQIGHDSRKLISECARLWKKAEAIDLELGIVPAHPEDAAGDQLLVMEALGAGRNVRAVLADVALEPVWARAMIAGMLDTGILATAEVEPPDTSPDDEATFDASADTGPEVSAGSEFATTEIIEGAKPYMRASDAPTMETEVIESPRRKARKLGEVIAARKSRADEPDVPKKGKKGKGAKGQDDDVPELELDPESDFEEDEPTVDSSRPVRVPDVRDLAPFRPESERDILPDFDEEPEEPELEPELESELEPELESELEPEFDPEDEEAEEDEAEEDEAEDEDEEAEEDEAEEDEPQAEEPEAEPEPEPEPVAPQAEQLTHADLDPEVDADERDLPSGGEAMLDFDALLRPGGGVDVEDDSLDLDAFADYDSARGENADGVFSTDQEKLDRIEVRGLDEETAEEELPEEEEPIEADEAPHAMFSGRLLSEDEALKKIEVANQAVIEVIQAFDASEGVGRGRATMQIVLDGSPQRFAVLFQGLKLGDGDELPADYLLRNLLERPQTEHRQLLNQGLVDLIERALSLAMDEITDDTAIDTLLERTAGYRQRIGL